MLSLATAEKSGFNSLTIFSLSTTAINFVSPTKHSFTSAFIAFETSSDKLAGVAISAGKSRKIPSSADDGIFLDFPADIATPANLSEEVSKAIKAEVNECFVGETKLMAVVDNEKIVKELKPDFSAVAKLSNSRKVWF